MIVRDTLFYRTLVSMARQRPGLDEPRCQAMLDILSAADALRSALRHSLHYAEISELLGIPVGTVKSRMHNSVAALKEAMVASDNQQAQRRAGRDADGRRRHGGGA